jgi:hypothetical protein
MYKILRSVENNPAMGSMQHHEDEGSGQHGKDGEDHHAEDAAAHAQVHPRLQGLVLRVVHDGFQQRRSGTIVVPPVPGTDVIILIFSPKKIGDLDSN